jgi:hypothetical protein
MRAGLGVRAAKRENARQCHSFLIQFGADMECFLDMVS